MPDFFDQVDGTGVIEDHIQEVLGLEKSEADSILSSYRAVRHELVDRLSRFPATSFSAQHLRGVLGQVQGAIDALTEQAAPSMVDSAYRIARKGIDHLTKEINLFDDQFTGAVTPINLNSALAARDVSNLLVDKYKTNLEDYGSGLMTQITNGLFNASLGASNYSQVVGEISKFFTADEWKLHRIVRTELHNIYNVGKIKGMNQLVEDDTIPDLMKTLMHPMDSRTGDDSKYAAKLRMVVGVNEPFVYAWGGKIREFMGPPDRPNDRAILVPYREAWGSVDSSAFVPGTFPKP